MPAILRAPTLSSAAYLQVVKTIFINLNVMCNSFYPLSKLKVAMQNQI
jgi:hypothetical protein